jgi:Methyltransferase domain
MRERMGPRREHVERLVRRVARWAGLDAVRADFNSPVVDPSALPATIWERESPMPGLELDLDKQLEMIEQRLSRLIGDFKAQPNPWYGPMDADLLFAMVRAVRPSRVLELGSGYSTLVIQQALEDGVVHEVVDPWPSPLLARLGARLTVRTQSAADVPEPLFEALGEGDILFVDTSHTVRPGGEVVRLVLEVLPQLRPGVIVQIHDFFRPFEYPRVLYEQFNLHWQEQYLVQAFLAYNAGFEILLANHALWRLRRDRVRSLFPALREGMEPSALWLRRV